jgi:HEAT repeat protein
MFTVALLGMTSPSPDLDLGVPTGTPLDWDKDLHQPIPTGLVGKEGLQGPAKEPQRKDQGTVMRPAVPPPVGYATVNLYSFFRVKTHDIMTHFKVNIPERKPVPPPPPPPPIISTGERGNSTNNAGKQPAAPAGGATFESGIESKYIPPLPGELVWIGIATCLRSQLHPEILSIPESLAYLIEIGEPSLVGPGSVQTPLGDRVKALVKDVPQVAPTYPAMKSPVDALCARIAVLELTSGYPLGMDPTYAKRTLLLGDLAYEAVLACAKSDHAFLSHNAVAVLANFAGSEKVSKDLWAVYEASQDPIVKVRALAGIARKRDRNLLDKLMAQTKNGDDWLRAMAIYALGQVAGPQDAKIASELITMAGSADKDMQWTILSAIARIGCKDPKVAQAASALWQNIGAKGAGIADHKPSPAQNGPNQGFLPPNPEPAGYKSKILGEFALIAAASCGDAAAVAELHNRAAAGANSFTEAARILMADVLAKTGPKGLELAKQIAGANTPSPNTPPADGGPDVNVAIAAIRAMGFIDPPDIDWLKQTATGGGHALVRAASLTALFRTSPTALKEVCHKIVQECSVSTPESAFLTGMAIQMLDRLEDNKGAEVLKVAQAANGAGMWANRAATDEYDITKAKIDVKPPLLEVATLALGKTGYDEAVPTLIQWLKSGPVRGEAALALGGAAGTKVNDVVNALLEGLVDPKDGWVRFCCYMSLKHITKQDYFTDYIFGTAGQIMACRDKYNDAWVAPKPNENK